MTDRYDLAQALHDTGRVELRVLHDGRGRSGNFDSLSLLADAIEAATGAGEAAFTTLNAPKLGVASNAMTGRPLTDADIAYIVRLPFDFDPIRPRGQNSSDDELVAALARRNAFVASMRSHGWPMPLLGMSGNGAHALYRCRFPATDGLREKLATIYTTLRHDFSDEVVLFDSTVRNPARIWRIYGTLNAKAPAADGRPQRMAHCKIPARWTHLSPRALERFAAICEKRKPKLPAPQSVPAGDFAAGEGDYRTLDAAAWFAAHGHYKRRLPGGKHSVVCPWRGEHSDPHASLNPRDSSTVLFEPSGAGRFPGFHCSHAHCAGRGIVHVMRLWGDADRYCSRQFRRRGAS